MFNVTRVNDIAATSDTTFYFTNSITTGDWLPRWLRNSLFLLRLVNNGNVGHYKDNAVIILTSSVDMANGIFMSQDKRY